MKDCRCNNVLHHFYIAVILVIQLGIHPYNHSFNETLIELGTYYTDQDRPCWLLNTGYYTDQDRPCWLLNMGTTQTRTDLAGC